MPPADLSYCSSSSCFIEHLDDGLFCVSCFFHGLGLSAAPKGTLGGKSLTQLWPNHRGKLGRGEALYGLFDTETGALGRN